MVWNDVSPLAFVRAVLFRKRIHIPPATDYTEAHSTGRNRTACEEFHVHDKSGWSDEDHTAAGIA